MSILTAVSALLWLKIDPTEQLVPEPVEMVEERKAA
jgi:hypothetical protein